MNKAVLTLLVWPILLSSTEDISYPSTPPKYEYEWQVNDNYSKNNYGQTEERDGSNTVGSYFVLLPDGRTQRVSYSVDPYGGYKAEVTYEGEAKAYDAPKPKYQPKQPPPKYQAQPSSYKPVSTKKVTESGGQIGQVYYKPLKEAPNAKVYYKPLPDTPSEVYYKPIEA